MNKEHIINLVENVAELTKQRTDLYGILIDIMKELSVIYPKHEIETLPAKVKEVVHQLTEAKHELHYMRTETNYYIEHWSNYSNCYFILHASEPNGGKYYSLEECQAALKSMKLEKARILKEERTFSYV